MRRTDKWYFESGKCYDMRYITPEYITDFEMFGDYIELFGGDYDTTETNPNCENAQDAITEIRQFVSFVYDIPEQYIKVSPKYANI